MSDCSAFRHLLSLSAAGDLEAAKSSEVRDHVALCQACRDEEACFVVLISSARRAFSLGDALPDDVRQRVAREAAARARRRGWNGLRVPLSAILGPVPRPGILATITAVLIALVVLPLSLPKAARQTAPADSVKVEVATDGKAVRLAWSDGTKTSYTVYKSSDPRPVARAEAHRVRGNVWVDDDPGSAPVVFYRIE